MNKIDYRKLDKDLYALKAVPSLIEVPKLNFIMVDGYGNPNDEGGEYQQAVGLLYALTYTIKMGRKLGKIKTNSEADNFIDYVVPPLEGLWWLEDDKDMNFTQKEKFCWTSMIRQPEFITLEVFLKAQEEVKKKKPELDITKARFVTFEEGLCVHCMHIGPFDTEAATVAKMDEFIKENHLLHDIGAVLPDSQIRRHHEIYMSDFRKANPATMKTIIRHPVKR